MMKFFQISIVWTSPPKPPEVLGPIVSLAVDWIALGPTLYVIYTAESTTTWQGRFRAVIADQDSFLITEISDVTATAGWMPKMFWEWLRKYRGAFQLESPQLRQINPSHF